MTLLPGVEASVLNRSQRPGAIPEQALEWHLMAALLLVGLFMLIFQPGWRAPLEQLALPGLHLQLPGYAWPAMLFCAGAFQLFALHRESKRLRRHAAGWGALVCLVMALSFAQANYFVVGVPIFLLCAGSQAFAFTVLRDAR